MGILGSAWRGMKNVAAKIRAGEEWYAEHISDPMLAEVEKAKEGDIPGEYSDRPSSWEEAVSATDRRRSESGIRSAAEQYTEALNHLEAAEEKRIGIAERFITHLPGGEISGDEVQMVTHVTVASGEIGPADPRPEKGDFDLWLRSAWPAFEGSDSADEFSRRIQSLSQNPENTLDPDVLVCWEDQLMMDNWADVFWEQYSQEYIPRYRDNLQRIEQCKIDIEAFAEELDRFIETKI